MRLVIEILDLASCPFRLVFFSILQTFHSDGAKTVAYLGISCDDVRADCTSCCATGQKITGAVRETTGALRW